VAGVVGVAAAVAFGLVPLLAARRRAGAAHSDTAVAGAGTATPRARLLTGPADQPSAVTGLDGGGDTLPARNPVFTGRDGALADLAGTLGSPRQAELPRRCWTGVGSGVVVPVAGLPGVGSLGAQGAVGDPGLAATVGRPGGDAEVDDLEAPLGVGAPGVLGAAIGGGDLVSAGGGPGGERSDGLVEGEAVGDR
jgi:hypothetical protein